MEGHIGQSLVGIDEVMVGQSLVGIESRSGLCWEQRRQVKGEGLRRCPLSAAAASEGRI